MGKKKQDWDDDYYHGFDDYVPTTVNPGPWLFIGTVILMASLALSIGPLVWIGRKWKKFRRARKTARKTRKATKEAKIEHPYVDIDYERETAQQQKATGKGATMIEMQTRTSGANPAWPIEKEVEPIRGETAVKVEEDANVLLDLIWHGDEKPLSAPGSAFSPPGVQAGKDVLTASQTAVTGNEDSILLIDLLSETSSPTVHLDAPDQSETSSFPTSLMAATSASGDAKESHVTGMASKDGTGHVDSKFFAANAPDQSGTAFAVPSRSPAAPNDKKESTVTAAESTANDNNNGGENVLPSVPSALPEAPSGPDQGDSSAFAATESLQLPPSEDVESPAISHESNANADGSESSLPSETHALPQPPSVPDQGDSSAYTEAVMLKLPPSEDGESPAADEESNTNIDGSENALSSETNSIPLAPRAPDQGNSSAFSDAVALQLPPSEDVESPVADEGGSLNFDGEDAETSAVPETPSVPDQNSRSAFASAVALPLPASADVESPAVGEGGNANIDRSESALPSETSAVPEALSVADQGDSSTFTETVALQLPASEDAESPNEARTLLEQRGAPNQGDTSIFAEAVMLQLPASEDAEPPATGAESTRNNDQDAIEPVPAENADNTTAEVVAENENGGGHVLSGETHPLDAPDQRAHDVLQPTDWQILSIGRDAPLIQTNAGSGAGTNVDQTPVDRQPVVNKIEDRKASLNTQAASSPYQKPAARGPFLSPAIISTPLDLFSSQLVGSSGGNKTASGTAALIREKEERALQDDIFLDTVDQILDPYINEADELRVAEVVPHADENGTAEGVLIDLYETSVLDQHPFAAGKNLGTMQQVGADRFHDGDEDPVPENAFDDYYREWGEPEETGNEDLIQKEVEGQTFSDFVQETTRGWKTFRTVLGCDTETRKIFGLAIPGTFEAISSSILGAISTALISKNVGPEAFTAYSLVKVFLGLTDSLIGGVKSAEQSLTAQAIGMENNFLAGQYAQLTAVLYVLLAIPTYALWIIFADQLVLALDLGEEVAHITQNYMPLVAFNYLINGVAGGLSTLLWSAEYGGTMALIDAVFSGLYVIVIAVLSHVYDGFGLNTVALVGIAYGALYGLFVFLFTYFMGWLEPYMNGLFKNMALKNGKLVKGVLKMAMPLSLGTLLAEGEWNILTFFAAYMGAAEVAAWSIAGAIWSVFEYAPGGLSTAAEIRIAFHLGNGNPSMAKISSYKTLLFSAVWSSIITVLFVSFSDEVIEMFTDDATLTKMMQELVPIMAVGNVMLCLGNDAYSVVTAQTRPKIATRVYFICTWFFALPLCAYFVFYRRYNLEAVVASVTISYGLVAVRLLYVVFTSNWAKISKKIISRAEKLEQPLQKDEEDATIETYEELPSFETIDSPQRIGIPSVV